VRIYQRLPEYRAALEAIRGRGGRIGLVTTMGALHAGHVSLLQRAAEECDAVAATIFVNPLQFGDPSDLAAYPRDLDHDLETCRDAGAAAVLVPTVQEMYPSWPRPMATTVSVGALANVLEGASRPGHFDGVASVVAKLFGLTGPCRAYFGEKDFQQLAVVRTMVRDLSIPVEVVGCPTVREPDGLAMSSRNGRLTPAERAAAPVVFEALAEGCRAVASGTARPATVAQVMSRTVHGEPLAELDYAAVVQSQDLAEPAELTTGRPGELRLLIAARLGSVRLIDNCDPLVAPVAGGMWADTPRPRTRRAGGDRVRSDA